MWLFVRFGGSFDYNNSINWLSAARLNSNLLNEAILDDGQALYRVRDIKKKQDRANNINISAVELRKLIAKSGGNPKANTIDEAFLRTVKTPKLQMQPRNVFLIVGESFGNWPFLPKFANIGIVPQMQRLMKSDSCAYVPTMIPTGINTINAVNGLLTGLPETGIYANYQPVSFKEKYAAGIANAMKKLGYKTIFWYGGYSSWEDVKNFAQAQGFDEFHSADEFGNATDNVWGCDDAVLFKHAEEYLQKESKDEKVFHLILTMSNHAPYIIDVDKLGFPREAVKAKLPRDISKDQNTLTELGHIWYADKTMGDFVAFAQKLLPDSLFVITGDHMERFTFAVEQDARVMMSVPCIFYGQGVSKDWFDESSVG
ncbi:MAG: LTA synthase family protein, partial [Phascolarctobacterium sp.]|nr:LTA synthase family protein [Phascolarctobacterium sp.]